MLLKDFIHYNFFRIETTAFLKIQLILPFLALKDVKIYIRDDHLHLIQEKQYCTQQKERIGLHKLTKITTIHMVVYPLKNYQGFL